MSITDMELVADALHNALASSAEKLLSAASTAEAHL